MGSGAQRPLPDEEAGQQLQQLLQPYASPGQRRPSFPWSGAEAPKQAAAPPPASRAQLQALAALELARQQVGR